MSIPVISDVLNTIRDVVKWFLTSAPTPVRYMFFLLMFAIIGLLIPLMLNSFGYHCNSNLDPVRVDSLNLFTQFDLSSNKPDYSTLKNNSVRVPDSCLTSTDYNSSYSDRWVYEGTYCTDCPKINNFCVGDGYPLTEKENNWWYKVNCGMTVCGPPDGYYFDYSAGNPQQGELYFVCYQPRCMGVDRASEINRVWDGMLEDAGAELVYDGTENPFGYESLFEIRCTGKLEPYWTVFGINPFQFKLWIVLFGIMILWWIYTKT